jgi:PAS domain S-box-containing protein
VFALDPSGQIVYANECLHQWLGCESGALVGRPLSSLMPEEMRDVADTEMNAASQGGAGARLGVLLRQDGTTFPVIGLPQAIAAEDGEFQGSVVLFVELGTVQTAKLPGALVDSGVRATLVRIGLELQSIAVASETPDAARVSLSGAELSDLSPRESEVLSHLIGGSRVPWIAQQLQISQHTVRNHLKSIYRKAGVKGQSELIEWAHSRSR